MYKLLNTDAVMRLRDGASIPFSLDNVDYQEYLSWLAAGNIPQPADIPDPRLAVQTLIDSLEREQLLPRVTREGLLLTMETFAAMQSITPAQLYVANIAYKKVKDFDTQITLLRAQL